TQRDTPGAPSRRAAREPPARLGRAAEGRLTLFTPSAAGAGGLRGGPGRGGRGGARRGRAGPGGGGGGAVGLRAGHRAG
ncbi:unnamed protein product, partial [Coccothraustes coccothraustes]